MPEEMPKFYIASGWENKDQVRELAKLLTDYGWEWCYDWTTCTKDDDYSKIAVAEINAIKDSDVVIVLLPGGRGTHIEMGAALALEKLVMLVGDKTTLFMPKEQLPPEYFHPKVLWGALPVLVENLARESRTRGGGRYSDTKMRRGENAWIEENGKEETTTNE